MKQKKLTFPAPLPRAQSFLISNGTDSQQCREKCLHNGLETSTAGGTVRSFPAGGAALGAEPSLQKQNRDSASVPFLPAFSINEVNTNSIQGENVTRTAGKEGRPLGPARAFLPSAYVQAAFV